MSHTAQVSISARGKEFLVQEFIDRHGLNVRLLWKKGETKPWATVNERSGFSFPIFDGQAEDLDDHLLSSALDNAMGWLEELKLQNVSSSLDIDIVVDNDVSYSPSFEFSVQTLAKVVQANLELALMPCCKYTIVK